MKISIITVTLNNFLGFKKTAESIVRQKLSSINDMEWIVIDGASTDNTISYIKQIESNVTYWISEPDRSIYEAMNKGIGKATGEYLLFLNAGDVFSNFDVVYKTISNPMFGKVDYLASDVYLTKNDKIVGRKKAPQNISGLYLYKDSLCHQSIFIKRERLLINNGYDLSYRVAADAKFFFQDIIMNNASYAKMNFYTVLYDISGVSSSNWFRTAKERQKFLLEVLPPRIYNDYEIMVHGSTLLERILSKIKKNGIIYSVITIIAIILFSPCAIVHRIIFVISKCRKL